MKQWKVSLVKPPLSNYGQVLGEGSWKFHGDALAQLPEEVAGSLQDRMFRQETYFKGLVLRSDGALLLVYRGVTEESAPLHGAEIEARLAHHILVWNDAVGRNTPVTHEEELAERVLFKSDDGLWPDEDFFSLYGIPGALRAWRTFLESERYKIASLQFEWNGTFTLTYRLSRCSEHAWSKYYTYPISVEAAGVFSLLDWFAAAEKKRDALRKQIGLG